MKDKNDIFTHIKTTFCQEPMTVYRRNMDEMKNNGGNALRVWLHTTGEGPSPYWSDNGFVLGTDRRGSLIDGEFGIVSFKLFP